MIMTRTNESCVRYFNVAVIAPVNKLLIYSYSDSCLCDIGSIVKVPLGSRQVLGLICEEVLDTGDTASDSRAVNIRNIVEVLPEEFRIPEVCMNFLKRVARYTMNPVNALAPLTMGIVQHYIKSGNMLSGAREEYLIAVRENLSHEDTQKLTAIQRKVIDILTHNDSERYSSETALARAATVSAGVVKKLIEHGVLVKVTAGGRVNTNLRCLSLLSHIQQDAYQQISDACLKQTYAAFLLFGVTGSGKTEVYLNVVAECLDRGEQVLVMLPEISLTDTFIQRVEQRLGVKAIKWHSSVSISQKLLMWQRIASGVPCVVVGARSALFLPFANLTLIIVDEEHDNSYKQEDKVAYSARDMAVLRSSMCDAVVVLCTATPSIETWLNACSGKYQRINLQSRYGSSVMPEVSLVNLRDLPLNKNSWIAPVVADEIRSVLEDGMQVMLFINRRGYAPLTLCRKCGYRFACPNCTSWLVEHRSLKYMMCHYCNYRCGIPDICTSCSDSENLVSCGPGVERLTEEASILFPEVDIITLSSDLVKKPGILKQGLHDIASRKKQLMIGTQVLSKGHHFPFLTLVVVIDADTGLYGCDFRASEKTWQLIRQVAGRAGREKYSGRVLIQTAFPDHPVMKMLVSGDDEGFLRFESNIRSRACAPPFGRYVAVMLSGKDETTVWNIARAYVKNGESMRGYGICILGPAPAPVTYIRRNMRVRILLKMKKDIALLDIVKRWLDSVNVPSSVLVSWDVDPYTFM